ncbi:MAG: hypothetical protein ACPG52_08505 [Cognaticolwellia sp.]
MTISDEICIIANKLANEGKNPSVALIKSQLNRSIPLPQLIDTLKTWQHDPEFIKIQHQKIDAPVTEEQVSNHELSALINLALAPLQQEIIELKQLVKQLIKDQQSTK